MSYAIKVSVNGAALSTSLQGSLAAAATYTYSMNVTSVNPVLKTKIGFTIDSNFPHALKREDFSINATSQTNSSYIRMMNVIAADDSKKTLTTMFGGAW